MNWRHVSVDDDRKVPNSEHYDLFMKTLEEVSLPEDFKDSVSRTDNDSPKMSYGVILVCDRDPEYLSYLCLQKRTTVEFGEIVKCGPRKNRLFEYLSNLTEKERNLLCEYSHERLWNDLLLEEKELWHATREHVTKIFEAYSDALPTLISLTETVQETPQWCFAKGRPSPGARTQLATAVKELEEEACIKLDNIILCLEEVVSDVYRGTDKQLYQTDYFVIKSEEEIEIPWQYLGTNCIGEWCISQDMSNYVWMKLSKTNLRDLKGSTVLPERLEKLLIKLHKLLCV
jgi:hypothetical protein